MIGHRALSLPFVLAAALLIASAGADAPWGDGAARAQTTGASEAISEKEAFDSAKELGTIEAWEAFLTRFPSGFRADLARAYVKRLAGEGSADTTQPAAPAAAPSSAAVAGGTGETLPALDLGPGNSPWSAAPRVVAASGNQRVYAASVSGTGLELVTYCADLSRAGGGRGLFAILKERPRGSYPDFDKRIAQALEAAPDYRGAKSMEMSFSSGESFGDITFGPPSSAGEVPINDANEAISQGPAFQELLSAETMTLSAPPFTATFQLDGSRAAICDVLSRCGVKRAECGGDDEPAASAKKEESKVTRASTCRAKGLDYVDGKCVEKKKQAKAKSKAQVERNAAAACKELGLAYKNGQCVAKLKSDVQRQKKQKKIGCPAGTYLNPLGVCQPNETGG